MTPLRRYLKKRELAAEERRRRKRARIIPFTLRRRLAMFVGFESCSMRILRSSIVAIAPEARRFIVQPPVRRAKSLSCCSTAAQISMPSMAWAWARLQDFPPSMFRPSILRCGADLEGGRGPHCRESLLGYFGIGSGAGGEIIDRIHATPEPLGC